MNPSILIVNGPGLDDPKKNTGNGHGQLALSTIRDASARLCDELGMRLDFRQANDGDQMLQWIANEGEGVDAVIINPVGCSYAGTVSIEKYRGAIQALAQLKKPVIEVHLDNIFRANTKTARMSYEPAGEMALICGFGLDGYLAAIRAIDLGRESHDSASTEMPAAGSKVYVLNGPNLNLLGTREPEVYGRMTLDDLESQCKKLGALHGLNVDFRQSNHEGEMVDWIQEANKDAQGIVINAAAYTHTSVAIHDALRAYKGYKIELHISNPHLRESFRHQSYVAPVVDGVVAGLGPSGYQLSVQLMADRLGSKRA